MSKAQVVWRPVDQSLRCRYPACKPALHQLQGRPPGHDGEPVSAA